MTCIPKLGPQVFVAYLLYISIEELKGGGETTPLDVIGKADKTPSQIAMLSIFYQTRHEEMVSGNTTSSNLIPESGISFCIVKSKGVVIRAPIKPLHRINALFLDIGR